MYAYVCMCIVCVRVCVYAYIYVHVYVHTHTHTHTLSLSLSLLLSLSLSLSLPLSLSRVCVCVYAGRPLGTRQPAQAGRVEGEVGDERRGGLAEEEEREADMKVLDSMLHVVDLGQAKALKSTCYVVALLRIYTGALISENVCANRQARWQYSWVITVIV
jgi:hypothetical protein